MPAGQHIVRRDGRMADEADLGARSEEPCPQVVALALGCENERGVGVVELPGDGKICASLSPFALSTTPAGFPVKRSTVKAST